MKLKHYYNMYYNKLREEEPVLAEATFISIFNKLCKLNNIPIKEQLAVNSTTPLNDIQGLLGLDYKPVVASLFSLGLEDLDYFRYYMLDKLTNGTFIDILLTTVFRHYKQGQFFLFNFNRYSFISPSSPPELIVEYRVGALTEIEVPLIVYNNPFNGDMELEDFLSMAMTDPIYILNPEKNSLYLLEKIRNGVTCIPYSQNKVISLIGLPQKQPKGEYVSWYLPNMTTTLLMDLWGKPIYKVKSLELGALIDDKMEMEGNFVDISQLTKNIYTI